MKINKRIISVATILLCLYFLAGCAAVTHLSGEKPQVSLKNISIVPGETTLVPRFKIDLHLVNPNSTPLPLHGIFYTLKLADEQILSGASNQLPTVAGYSEEDISLFADVDLAGGVKLVKQLLNGKISNLDYLLDAKIDTGKFSPSLHLQEKGKIIDVD